MGEIRFPQPPGPPDAAGPAPPSPDPLRRPVRVAHLTTVDMSLAWLLAGELRADVEAGLEVLGLSAPGPFVPEIEALGVTHVAVPSLTRSWNLAADVAAARELAVTLASLELDVLHTHTPKAGVLGRMLGRMVGIPVVVNTCHGLWAGQARHPAIRAVATVLEAKAAWFSDVELYQNDADRTALRHLTPAWRARTVGNGVPLDRFAPDPRGRARVRAELGVADDEVLVGGVGRRVAEKGLAELAAAADALGDRARFVWVGPGDPDKSDHVERAASEALTFVDTRTDMPAVYSAFDVFALPSWREGFSRSAMEAAACGCAMAVSDVRGCREIGDDGVHLRLVAPGDADAWTAVLGELVDDAAQRRALGAAAAERARVSFDQRRVAAQSVAAYRDVAARRARRR